WGARAAHAANGRPQASQRRRQRAHGGDARCDHSPVHVKLRTRIGKEITVDPTETDEDYTAEMLSATNVLKYCGTEEKLEALRAAVRLAGIKRITRISGAPRSQLQGLVNQKTTPNAATIGKIEA